jgi:hypothetical protein
MSIMWRIAVVFVVGCGGTTRAPVTNQSQVEPVAARPASSPSCYANTGECRVEVFSYFASRTCACTSGECVDDVEREVMAWFSEALEHDEVPATAIQTAQITAELARYTRCAIKFPAS